MSKVDTAWLRMEQPTNLMMINGVIMMDSNLDYEKLIETIEQRFLTFRRFRQKAVDTARGAYWVLDEDFDIRCHVRRTALPGAADQDELQLLVSQLASTPLDISRPLWQLYVVENYVDGPVILSRRNCVGAGIPVADRPDAGRPAFSQATGCLEKTPGGRIQDISAPARSRQGRPGFCDPLGTTHDPGRQQNIGKPRHCR
jgi:hypothetical protein